MKKFGLQITFMMWLAAPAAILCQGNAADLMGQNDAAGADAVSLEIRPVANESDAGHDEQTGHYKLRGMVDLEVLMTNKSSEPLTVTILDTYYDNRPRLSRGGKSSRSGKISRSCSNPRWSLRNSVVETISG
jgi:hypothetical protein